MASPWASGMGGTRDLNRKSAQWKGTTESKRNCLATGETIAVVASLPHAKEAPGCAKESSEKERGELAGESQEHPLVLPQFTHLKQLPFGAISAPHIAQGGASPGA